MANMTTLEELRGKNVFIAGSEKNAGKTTFLNYALHLLYGESYSGHGIAGIMSIGIDGEETDGIFGNPKPRVTVEKDSLFICTECALACGSLEYEIINVYPFSTAIGRPVLARALRRGEIEISGPENNSQLAMLIADMRTAGAETVFIDGAADRLTHSGTADQSVLAYVARVAPDNFSSAVERIKIISAASECPLYLPESMEDDGPDSSHIVRIEGALTETKAGKITAASTHPAAAPAIPDSVPSAAAKPVLVADSPASVFLSWLSWRRLASAFSIHFLHKNTSTILIINLYNIDKADFEKKFTSAGNCRVLYNPYIS